MRFIADAPPEVGRSAFGGLASRIRGQVATNDMFFRLMIMNEEISHFVRNDG